jgi:hypothetical protein
MPLMQNAREPWRSDPNAVGNALVLLLGAGAIYVGITILIGYLAAGTAFGSAPAEVWRALISAQGVLWSAAVWLNRADMVRVFRGRTATACAYAGGVLLALIVPTVLPKVLSDAVFAMPEFEIMGPDLGHFMLGFVSVGSIIAALIATIVGVAFVELRQEPPTYQGLVDTRQRLKRSSTTLSVILVVAVASTSWLQRSLESAEAGAYPKEIVFSYGLYFTALLLVVYLPATAEFYRAATWLADDKFPLADFDKDVAQTRGTFLTDLGITKGDTVQAALAAASPIVSAVLTMALGKD